jgi:hypothetical protein
MEAADAVENEGIQYPRQRGISALLVFLIVGTIGWYFGFRYLFTKKCLSYYIHELGVSYKRVQRTVKELKRKTFHLLGLLIPSIYFFGMRYIPWFNRRLGVVVLGSAVLVYWTLELLRVISPRFRAQFESSFSGVMRAKERLSLTGVGFYLLGNFICVFFLSPTVALSGVCKMISLFCCNFM